MTDTSTQDRRSGAPSRPKTPRELRLEQPPRFVRDEMDHHLKYPYVLEMPHVGVHIRYRRSSYRFVGGTEGQKLVRKRSTFCWIEQRGERIGALEINEFKLATMIHNVEFLDEMDIDCRQDHDFSEVLCSQWDPIGPCVGDYGNIIEFAGAWMNPVYVEAQGLWALAALHLLEKSHLRAYAIVALKAFPLEYTARFDSRYARDKAEAAACDRRQRAMERHYAKLLDVRPFDGEHGRAGWMWKPNPRLEDLFD